MLSNGWITPKLLDQALRRTKQPTPTSPQNVPLEVIKSLTPRIIRTLQKPTTNNRTHLDLTPPSTPAHARSSAWAWSAGPRLDYGRRRRSRACWGWCLVSKSRMTWRGRWQCVWTGLIGSELGGEGKLGRYGGWVICDWSWVDQRRQAVSAHSVCTLTGLVTGWVVDCHALWITQSDVWNDRSTYIHTVVVWQTRYSC